MELEGTYRPRCAEHDLAVGPDGGCVLCRRTAVRPSSARPMWLSPVLLAAGLGSTLLGGVALARSRTVPPPVVVAEATPVPVEAPQPLAPPVQALHTRPAPVLETLPSEPAPEPQPATVVAPAPRDYLGEAYAAMNKRGLYDEPRPSEEKRTSTTTKTECPCKHGGCQRLFTYTRTVPVGGAVPGAPVRTTVAGGSTMPMQHAGGTSSPSGGLGRVR